MTHTFKYSTRFQMPDFKLEIREVVRVMMDRPHLLVRAIITGTEFPHRDAPAFIHIRTGDDIFFRDYLTEVASDGLSLIGYLPVDMPEKGIVEFGFGDQIWGRIPGDFTPALVDRLDRKRLPKDLIVVDKAFMKRSGK